jgi:hypothetical protein
VKWSTFFKGLYYGVKLVLPAAKAAANSGIIRGDGGKILSQAVFLRDLELEVRKARIEESRHRPDVRRR